MTGSLPARSRRVVGAAARFTGALAARSAIRHLLSGHGYAHSVRTRRVEDQNGDPLPWYTYPAIEYLAGLDFSQRRVFEFGAGNSTRWWRSRAAEVISVESDRDWYHQLAASDLGGNGELRLAETGEAFIDGGLEDGLFDVVVVDGVVRRQPAERALEMIHDGSMIILDNSDWMPLLHRRLRDAGLLAVDFHGFGPAVTHTWTTSLFLGREADFWGDRDMTGPVGSSRAPASFTEHDQGLR